MARHISVTPTAAFLYNQRSCCHEDSGPVWKASLSAVQKSGTRFLITSETSILLRLFTKPSKLSCFLTNRDTVNCNALSASLLEIGHYNYYHYDFLRLRFIRQSLPYLTLPYLTSGVGRLLHLASAEAVSAQPKAHTRM